MLEISVAIGVGVLLLIGIVLLLYSERGRILRRSMARFLRIRGLRNVLRDLFNLKLLKLYIYGRWTKHYIGHQKKRTLPRMRPKNKQGWAPQAIGMHR